MAWVFYNENMNAKAETSSSSLIFPETILTLGPATDSWEYVNPLHMLPVSWRRGRNISLTTLALCAQQFRSSLPVLCSFYCLPVAVQKKSERKGHIKIFVNSL